MDIENPVEAKFFDGRSARMQAVVAHIEMRHGAMVLVISLPDEAEILWPMSELREVTDQARDEGIVLSFGQDGVERLILPHGASEDVIRDHAPNLGKRRVSNRMIRNLVLWLGGAVASVVLIMFVILPALANQLATMIPPEREAALGNTAIRQISRFLGSDEEKLTCDNPAGVEALDKMTKRMVGFRTLDYDLNVRVFDHEMVNAFAVPGGHVVLFKGLLDAAETPEEVAGVLGHEIGHVVNRDPTRLTLRSAGSIGILGMIFGDFAGGALALILAEQLISASYAQDAEANADEFAHELLAEAKLPSEPFAQFFIKLKDEYGDSEGLLSHLASHPNLQGRADAAIAADSLNGLAYRSVLSPSEWSDLKKICD